MNFFEFSQYLYNHKSTRLGNTWEDWHGSLLSQGFNCLINKNNIEYVKYILIKDNQYEIKIYQLFDIIQMEFINIDNEEQCTTRRIMKEDTTLNIIGEMFEECLNFFVLK